MQLPDGTRQLAEASEYESRQLARAQEGVNLKNQMALRNNERLDQVALENQRLVMAQQSASNETALQAQRMYGQQQLDNTKLSDGWRLEVERLRMTQKAIRDEYNLKLKSQESESLTQFGAALVGFSQVLGKQRAEETNRRNQEIRAMGQIDEALGLGSTSLADLYKVDQSQRTRLAAQAESTLVAQELNRTGRPNEATNVLANNEWYLYGRSEMQILKSAGELDSYLRKVVDQAEQEGLIQKGDSNADAKLSILLNTASRRFFIEKGLVDIPPPLLAKYFGDALLSSQAGISKEWNSANKKFVQDTQKSLANGQLIIGFDAMAKDPAEARKHIDQYLNVYGGDYRGVDEAFKILQAEVFRTGNRAPLDNFMLDPRAQRVASDYSQFQYNWQELGARKAEKQQGELKNGIWGGFLNELQGVTSAAALNEIKARWVAQAEALPLDLAGPLKQQINGFRPSDLTGAQIAYDSIMQNTPPDQLPGALERLKAQHPDLPYEFRQRLEKAADSVKAAVLDNPEIKQLFEEAKLSIVNQLDPKSAARRKMDAAYSEKEQAVVRRRRLELERRFKVWAQRPGATPDGFREWLQNSNRDLLGKPITDDGSGRFMELVTQVAPRPSSSEVPSLPRIVIPATKRSVVSYISAEARSKLIEGRYGRINSAASLMMTPNEIQEWGNQYESGNGVNQVLKKLAERTGISPTALLETQAQIYGMQGRIQHPTNYQRTPDYQRGTNNGTRVEPNFARTSALQYGLSARGATWFATNMMDESKGDPTAVHDQGTGLGLFGHRLGRREALKQFAASQGTSPTDPFTQLQFSLQEIKTKYPHVWTVVSAPNPTTNQLWRASIDWLGFNQSVYAHRFNSLRRALGEQ
jgi:hypothetical protein